MARSTREGVAAAFALCAFSALMTAGCTDRHESGERAAGEHAGEDFSVYDLNSKWQDQAGTARTLSSLRGRPQVLALIYTTCTAICPMTVSAMQEVESKAGPAAGFVLVSMDPERDSPARLAEYAKQRKLSPRWTLLSGGPSAVRELAAVLGVKYRSVSPTEIVHTSALTILDANGRRAAQYSETDAVDRAVRALQQLPR